MSDSRSRWTRHILPTESVQAFVAYWLWLRSSFNQAFRDRGAGLAIEVVHPEAAWNGRSVEWKDLLKRAKRVAPDAFTTLDALASERRFLVDRIQLAVLRMLEPLLESFASGGIERHHRTLTDDDLADFVRAGLRREVVLLSRENDLARVQHARKKAHLPSLNEIPNAILDSLDDLIPGRSADSEPREALSHLIREMT